jgi:hypothetical protein
MRTLQLKEPARRSAAVLLATALLGACVVRPAGYGYGPPPGYGGGYEPGPYVTVAPPPVQVEMVGIAPGHGYFWIGGFWNWADGRHEWVGGHWEAPREGYRYVPHRWASEGSGYRLHPGHWEGGDRRAGDRGEREQRR